MLVTYYGPSLTRVFINTITKLLSYLFLETFAEAMYSSWGSGRVAEMTIIGAAFIYHEIHVSGSETYDAYFHFFSLRAWNFSDSELRLKIV